MSPGQELKLDNLITELALEIAQIKNDREQRELVLARLDRIERAVGAPLTCGFTYACKRLGFSVTWGREHIDLFPKPVSAHRYLVSDIDAMVQRLESQPIGRKQRKRRGKAA